MKDDYMLPFKYSTKMEHSKWVKEIPFITFPLEYQIQFTPPFGGAVSRFQVKKGDVKLSVYLDCYDALGIMGEPYWEVYPVDGENERCYMNDTDQLLRIIERGFKDA